MLIGTIRCHTNDNRHPGVMLIFHNFNCFGEFISIGDIIVGDGNSDVVVGGVLGRIGGIEIFRE